MSIHLALLIAYWATIVGLGLWTAGLVRSGDFFVAGRRFGPGLGLSAWWWVGSAGIGSLVFGFIVAPRLWQVAKKHILHDRRLSGVPLQHRSPVQAVSQARGQ